MTDTTTITKTAFFNASPATVWGFLTRSDKLAKWFHPAKADLSEGDEYALLGTTGDSKGVPLIWGRVLEMDVPNRLVYTFIIDAFGGSETTVTWVLEEAAGGTRLSLTHEGVPEAAGEATMRMLMSLDSGWDEHLDRLRKSLA